MKNQRIAIIGAGTAGLATATLLGRQGHAVTLFERAPSLTAVGAGILLQPSGISALSELGCLEPMLRYGHRIDALTAVPHKRWFGCEVEAIEHSANEALVKFRHASQSHSEAFDAVLVANGSASQLRPQSLVRYDRQYPWGALG